MKYTKSFNDIKMKLFIEDYLMQLKYNWRQTQASWK